MARARVGAAECPTIFGHLSMLLGYRQHQGAVHCYNAYTRNCALSKVYGYHICEAREPNLHLHLLHRKYVMGEIRRPRR